MTELVPTPLAVEHPPCYRWAILWPVAIVALALLAYGPSLRNGYIWDDDYHVTNNVALRSLHGLGRIWFEPGAVPQYYPLTHSSFWIEYHLWGLNPLGYHVDNLLLHAANAVLLGILLSALRVPGGWLAAAVFAVHPVEVETVAWVSERKNLLSGFFYVLAGLAYCRTGAVPTIERRGRWQAWYALSMALFVCALLSKTVASTWPAAVLVLIFWERGRLAWRDVWPLVPMFVVGAIMGSITGAMERYHVGARGSEWAYSVADRILIAGRAVWFYAGKLLWPAQQQFIYPRWTIDPARVVQWFAPAGVLAVLVLLWAARGRLGRGPLAAVLLFVGTLVPALGFVNLFPMRYAFVADHFQYLAGAWLMALVAAGLWRIPVVTRSVIVVPMLIALVLLTRRYTPAFRDAPTLWQDVLAKDPTNWIANNNVGDLLLKHGQVDEAERHFVTATRSYAFAAESWVTLGSIAEEESKTGNLAERSANIHRAFDCYATAVRLRPGFAVAHYDLANMLMVYDRFTDAVAEYRLCLSIDPSMADAHANLAAALLRLGNTANAKVELQRAMQLDPGLSVANEQLRKIEQSERQGAH